MRDRKSDHSALQIERLTKSRQLKRLPCHKQLDCKAFEVSEGVEDEVRSKRRQGGGGDKGKKG